MCGGWISISPDFVLEHAVLVGDAFAQMLELEPRFDQVCFLEPPELAHILEDAPGEGAVALAFFAEFVHRAQESRAVLRIDPIFDFDQNRAAIVRDVLGCLRAAPMQGRRQVDSFAL